MSKTDLDYDITEFTISNSVPVNQLECLKAFDFLNEEEKKYAHFLSRAAFNGGLIVLLQTSSESSAIFLLLQALFSEQTVESLKDAAKTSDRLITDEDLKSLLTYAAGFYCNMGNYKSFGDTKIVPAISQEKFKSIIWASEAYKQHPVLMEPLWEEISKSIYNLKPIFRELGSDKKGISTYYSANVTKEDFDLVQEFMKEKDISSYNTRLFKNYGKYELRLASVAENDKEFPGPNGEADKVASILGDNKYKGCTIKITRGDYSPLLKRVVNYLQMAKKYAANDNERSMLDGYIHCFNTGSIDAHKDGSRFWIRDKGPIIESYIGFIESYRDPYGLRGEFEGFVAMVNKEMSAKFEVLVERAEKLLPLLPWSAEFEKDKFLRPDFTSLDILSFAGSGIPAGINIPNYDDIRQTEGFKNVSLGNVLKSYTTDKNVTFLEESEKELYAKLKGQAFEVQVGLHELLGHGSGKLFRKEKDGKLNFDQALVKSPISGEKIQCWYKPGETWDSIFSTVSSSYEECRAECVGLHLCLSKEVLSIFGHEGQQAEDIIYINWLNMVRAGLLGLEFYSPKTQTWKQAHMQARFVILQVLLEAGNGFVTLKQTTGEDEKPDLLLVMDKTQIETVGKMAIADFLQKLQFYKSTADYESGKALYNGYSAVPKDFAGFREIVLARKQPRRLFVQAHTELINEKVQLQEFEATTEGIIQSFVKRFPFHDSELEQLWCADKKFHYYQ